MAINKIDSNFVENKSTGKSVRAEIGELSNLSTQEKTSLVDAVNENVSQLAQNEKQLTDMSVYPVLDDTRELKNIIEGHIESGIANILLNDSNFLITQDVIIPSGKHVFITNNSDYEDLPIIVNFLNTSVTIINTKNGSVVYKTAELNTSGNIQSKTIKNEFYNGDYSLGITKNVDDFDMPTGFYRTGNKDDYTTPLPESFGVLINYRLSNTVVYQLFITSRLYIRFYVGGIWSEWEDQKYKETTVNNANLYTVNDKRTTGTYYIEGTLNTSERPFELTGNRHVLEVVANNNVIKQTLTSFRKTTDEYPTEYYRMSINGGSSWSRWRSAYQTDVLQRTIDFNTLTEAGTYRLNSNSHSHTNHPSAYTGYGILEVVKGDTYVLQRLTIPNTGETYTRTTSNMSTWTNWIKNGA